jgi:RNA polymerase sigma-70 factor (ECF subfamily)
MEKTDSELIELYIGDKDMNSLNVLIRRYLKIAYNFAYHFTNDSREAEDITQESFIKVWKNISRFDKNRKFKPWLLKIVRNTALDYFKKRKDYVFSKFDDLEGNNPILDTLPDVELTPVEMSELKDDVQMLKSVVSEMPIYYRQVLSLYYEEGLTLEEVATILDKSKDTVKSQHRRAIIYLKSKLAPKIGKKS